MQGARFIANARYFHIADNSEKLTKFAFAAEAAANLVNYIATRESVVFNFTPEYEHKPATEAQIHAIDKFRQSTPDIVHAREYRAYQDSQTAANATRLITRAAQYTFGVDQEGNEQTVKPATRAQRERIREFVERVPEIRKTPEYLDYKSTMSRSAASEVLSHALEVALESAADPETLQIMLNYIAERPGVVRSNEQPHGLFCSSGAADLEAEKDAIAAVKGNVFSIVFSLTRQDADALGYNQQEPWRDLLISKQAFFAKAMHIPVTELHWIAAVHNTTHHPHAHFIAYSTNPKTRMYLSKQAIEEIKSELVSEIFRDERYQIYKPREEVKQQLLERTEKILQNMDDNASDLLIALRIPEKLAVLKKDILASKGRHVYKYLPKDIKSQVDSILDELSKIPEIRALLDEYGKYQKQLEMFYKTDPEEHIQLSQITTRDNLYRLKNLVVESALSIELPDIEEVQEEEKTGTGSGFEDKNSKRIDYVTISDAAGRSPAALYRRAIDGDADDKYRYAQYLQYSMNTSEDALLWYNLAEQQGHAAAAYQLAQHYFRDPDDRDLPLANEYLLKAKLRLEDNMQFSKDEDGPARYIFEDIEAGLSYPDAKESGYTHPLSRDEQRMIANSAFLLGRIYLTGVELDGLPGIDPEDISALQIATNYKKAVAFLEFAFDCGKNNAAYHIGKIYYRGELNDTHTPEFEKALEWYRKAADFDPYSRFALGQMIRHGEGTNCDTEAASALFRNCLSAPEYIRAESAYTLAEMQSNGELPMSDMQALYSDAARIWEKQPIKDTFTYQKLARMYEYGLGVEADLHKAITLYEQCDQSPEMHYKLGQLLHRINGDPQIVFSHYATALKGLLQEETRTEGKPDAQRALRLATMYRYGLGTDRDDDAAKHWYSTSTDRGSSAAETKLNEMLEHERQQKDHSKAIRIDTNLSIAQRLLGLIGSAIRNQTVRDQSPGSVADRKQRRMQRRMRHALGQKEDNEQTIR